MAASAFIGSLYPNRHLYPICPPRARGARPARGQSMLDRAPRLKGGIVKMHSCVLTRFPKGARKNTQHPAPGYRDFGRLGALGGVGNSGYGWASTSYDSGDHYRGMYLHFGATALHPSLTTYRAYGRQLRCLSE